VFAQASRPVTKALAPLIDFEAAIQTADQFRFKRLVTRPGAESKTAQQRRW